MEGKPPPPRNEERTTAMIKMLNTLASYLLGYPGSSPAGEPAAQEPTVTAHVPNVDVRLSAVEAADDEGWLLVDKTDENEEQEEGKGVDATCVPSRLTLAVSTTSYHWPGQSQDGDERPGSGAGLEESWFVTPPPCFTSGSVPLETSPLENLLIEHPSMSVYHRSAGGQGSQGSSATLSSSVGASPPTRSPQRGSVRKLNRPGSGASGASGKPRAASSLSPSPAASSPAPSEAASSASSEVSPARPSGSSAASSSRTVQPQPPPRRPNAYSPYQQQQQSAQYRTAQRLVQRAACQQLKRDSSERYNKAREILSSRNKRQRRSDRMQRHSGANNNRKC